MVRENELVLEIAETVAARKGVDITELESPLHEAIDTEALESLFATPGVDASVAFEYCGYTVRVDGDGDVRVSEPTPDATATKVSA
ncbi:HalOD1 output domain-containing protein [Natronorubrum sp. DTA28]|uniref:HalOD1 output domain-containing protein n=1 Tax=Natronorubrum sp. DTA28 TaxID=3447019 RepID=UPI003F8393D3